MWEGLREVLLKLAYLLGLALSAFVAYVLIEICRIKWEEKERLKNAEG